MSIHGYPGISMDSPWIYIDYTCISIEISDGLYKFVLPFTETQTPYMCMSFPTKNKSGIPRKIEVVQHKQIRSS